MRSGLPRRDVLAEQARRRRKKTRAGTQKTLRRKKRARGGRREEQNPKSARKKFSLRPVRKKKTTQNANTEPSKTSPLQMPVPELIPQNLPKSEPYQNRTPKPKLKQGELLFCRIWEAKQRHFRGQTILPAEKSGSDREKGQKQPPKGKVGP